MKFSDDDAVSEGNKASHADKHRGGTPVANTFSDKTNKGTRNKSKKTVTDRQREKTQWYSEKDDENVQNIFHDKVENLHLREDKNKSLYDVISVVIASFAVSIALYTYFVPVPLFEPEKPLKVEPENIYTQQQFINGLSERLYIVESRLSDIKQCTCRTDDTYTLDENLECENRVIKSENDLSTEVNTNKKELKYLKDEFQKLKDQIDVKCGDIIYVREEQKEFQAAVIHLNEKLEERSQFVEEKNGEVSQQMFQHNETMRDLNLHVEIISSTLNTLNEYVKSQVITSLSDINITVNKMTTKDDIQKLNEGLKSNVTTLERKLGEVLQSTDKKNAELMQLIVQHSETPNGLNVSVENHGTNLHILNFSVESLQTNVTTLERMFREETQSTDKKNTEMMQLILQHNETLNGLNESLTNYGTNLHNQNVSVERLQTNVTTLEKKLRKQSQYTDTKSTEMMQLILQHNETLNGLNVSVENHDTNLHNLNVYVERLQTNVTTLERKLGEVSQSTDKKNAEMMQLILQHSETLNGLSVSVENHDTNLHNLNVSVERLQTNVTTLERKLGEVLQSTDKKNAEMMQLILQHSETLNGLNASVQNHGTNLHNLNVSVERLQTNVTTLERKLGEVSQSTNKKNAEMMQLILQHSETLNGLNVSVENHGTNLHNLNVSVERLQTNVTTLERKLGKVSQSSDKKNTETMQLILQHSETLNGLNASVQNHGTNLHNQNVSVESLQTNVTTLERKLGEVSQSTDKKNAEMMQLILQHNETLNDLNVSVESHGISLHNLNVSVENHSISLHNLNVSVENHIISLHSLNVSATNYGTHLHSLNVSVENLVSNIRIQIVSLESYDSTIRSRDVSLDNTDIRPHSLEVSVENHGTILHSLNASVERLQTNVTTLEIKLGEQSQSAEKKNIEMMQLFLQHNKTLNVSVENHGSSLHSLNVSVENHGCNLRSLNVSIENHDSTIRSLNVSVENHGINLHDLNVSVERLQRNVTTLERMLAEQSQSAEKKNNNESLKGLTLFVENHGSSLHSLNVSVSNHDTNLHNLNVSVERLQANVTTLQRKFGEHSLSAEKKDIEMMQQMLHYNETLNGLVASLENHGNSLHILDVSVTNHSTNLHNINVSVENLGRNLHSLNVSLESHDSTIRSLNVSGENIGISLHGLNVSVKALDSSLLSLKYFVDSLDTSLRRLNVSVEHHGFNIGVLNVSVDNLLSNVKQPTKNITGIYIENIVLEKRTEHIVDNKVDKGSLIVVIMINITLLVLVIIYLVASRKPQRHLSGIVDSQQQQSPAPYSTAGRILSQVRANPRLERKLCVISFNEETHPLHMRMTQSVTQQLNQALENLEDPTLGLGDLRLTIVQAVQKMGGNIVIFYVGDLNSRHLNPMKLYNEDLASVKKQRELSALNRLCRFVSAYDKLTDNQKAHLRQIVRELCSR